MKPLRWRPSASRITCTVVAGLLLATSTLFAEPGSALSTQAAGTGGLTVSLAEMGLGGKAGFTVPTDSADLLIPVPDGLAPTTLTGAVTLPGDASRVEFEVSAAGRLLGSEVFVPPAAGAAPTKATPISIPLTGVEVSQRAFSLHLAVQVSTLDQGCPDLTQFQPFTLVGGAIRFSGADRPPATVAAFLPPILRTLSVYVPPQPSAAEQSAVLSLTSAVAAHFSGQPTVISVSPLPASGLPLTQAPLDRSVVIREAGTAGLSLISAGHAAPAVLQIAGPDGQLAEQITALTADIGQIAVASAATASYPITHAQLTPALQSLSQLGISPLTADGLASTSVTLGIDQARLGGVVGSLQLHLRGGYTAIGTQEGGSLTLSVGAATAAAWPLSTTGRFDHLVTVPGDALSRYVPLVLTLRESSLGGACGEQAPVELDVDGASSIRTTLLSPSAAGGFDAVPQALLPGYQVGMDSGDVAELARTTELVVGLQRLTTVPLQPDLVPLRQAETSRIPALLVYSAGSGPADLDAPLQQQSTTELELRAKLTTSVRGTLPVSCLQVFVDTARRRTVVLASSTGGGALLDSLLGWLNADSTRLPTLTGDVLVQAATGDPVSLTVRAGGPQNLPPLPIASHSTLWRDVIAAVVVVVVVIALGLVVLTFRRRAGRPPTHPEPS